MLLSVDDTPVEEVLADESASWATPVWRKLFPHLIPPGAYAVSYGSATLLYSLDKSGVAVGIKTAQPAQPQRITVYDRDGSALNALGGAGGTRSTSVTIGYRQYALVVAAPGQRPK